MKSTKAFWFATVKNRWMPRQCQLIWGLWLVALLLASGRLRAQSNAPVRLALIAESEEVSSLESVLNFNLSQDSHVAMLERNEVQKVYHEQSLSAENRNYIKLGQILGADGLYLVDLEKTATQTNLSLRLVAVKPGVVLASDNFPWPLTNISEFGISTAEHLKPFLPKLGVLVKDAIPLSVVNMRSAVASSAAMDLEREAKLLTIQRLSHEPQFFVLERQKMQLLGDEKNLKGVEDSAFWSGSYLLEGVLDRGGYSETTLTIDAQLTPAKGGSPLVFQVKGSRTNLAEVINQLALKISDILKAKSTGQDWNPTDEAVRYFTEANWALHWGILPEAQMASDSAWALGKQDIECANLRMNAYLPTVTSGMADFFRTSAYFGKDLPVEEVVRDMLSDFRNRQFAAYTFQIHQSSVSFLVLASPPPPDSVDRAIKTLALYEYLSHALASQLGSSNETARATAAKWRQLGVVNLTTTAKVLQRFQFIPGSEKPVAEKLADLRAEARRVDKLVSDNLCEVRWGCFWQENPEECLSLYRDLLKSPDFHAIHDSFWIRNSEQPRLTAWNERDRSRIPELWSHFTRELEESTNVLWRMEARALAFADAANRAEQASAFTNLFTLIDENSDELMTNKLHLFRNFWGLGELFRDDSFRSIYSSTYRPKLEVFEQRHAFDTVPNLNEQLLFPQQKRYLETNATYDSSEISRLFFFTQIYTKAEARKLQPLIDTYRSNLFARAQSTFSDWNSLRGAMDVVSTAKNRIDRTLNPSIPLRSSSNDLPPRPARSNAAVSTNAPLPNPAPAPLQQEIIRKPVRLASPPNSDLPSMTNILVVNKFAELPLDRLADKHRSLEKITAHQFIEGKVLLNVSYTHNEFTIANDDGSQNMRAYENPSAILVFDPNEESWEVVACPQVDVATGNKFRYRTTLFQGQIYQSNGGKISRYDKKTQKWEPLPISNDVNYELFNVAGHLYAANGSTIFEITDSGKSTRLLCSTRRNPPVTLLDSQSLGTPILTEGPNHSLRVIGKDKIFSLSKDDWIEDGPAPQRTWTPQILPEGVLFRMGSSGSAQSDQLLSLNIETKSPDLLLLQQGPLPKVIGNNPDFYKKLNATSAQAPLWPKPKGMALVQLAATLNDSDLYLLADHSQTQDIVNSEHVVLKRKVSPKDNYHAALFHFSRISSQPQTVFLRFDSPDGYPPATGIEPRTRPLFPHTPPVWMLFTHQFLILGIEDTEGISPETRILGYGYKTGIWLLPLAQLKFGFAAQNKLEANQTANSDISKQDAKQILLAKYDTDHNGVIEGEEKEEAFKDWDFLESELNIIDANRDHRLGVTELAYFDANTNGILEPNEESAIYAVQELLAQKLLMDADRDEDGRIDQSEFFVMVGKADLGGFYTFQKVEAKSEAERLEIYLRNHLKESINPQGWENLRNPSRHVSTPAPTTFKEKVENYWAWLKTRPSEKKP